MGPMSSSLAVRQLALIDWDELRSGSGSSARRVAVDLRALLGIDDDVANEARADLENPVVSQGHLFECAPAVVSVIVAAVADGTIPPPSLGEVLDLLGRIVAGYSAPSELALGRTDLRRRCHEEAWKGYWALMRVACARDPFNAWKEAVEILSMLDPEHSERFGS